MKSRSKIALVTGAGSGIGKGAALALMKDGFSVILAGRRIENLQEVESQGKENGIETLAVSTDVRSEQSVNALFSSIKEKFGRLDLLFNNAGISPPPGPFEDGSFEHWKEIVETNLNGQYLCGRAAFKMMKEQSPKGGRIINCGSVASQVPRPFLVAYAATKHGTNGLTKTMALEGRKHQIACGQIDYGGVRTELVERLKCQFFQSDGKLATESVLDMDQASKAIVYMANLPLEVNVLHMTLIPTDVPFVGRG